MVSGNAGSRVSVEVLHGGHFDGQNSQWKSTAVEVWLGCICSIC